METEAAQYDFTGADHPPWSGMLRTEEDRGSSRRQKPQGQVGS